MQGLKWEGVGRKILDIGYNLFRQTDRQKY